MRRTFVFLITTAALILFVSYLSSYVPSDDPFGTTSVSSTFTASGISQSTIAKMKLRHAALSPTPYDVGLFGNSRVLNVSADDIDHQACRVFNFAVGGESLRASAALIDDLIAIKKVPRVIVISVDHFELQMYNNPFFVSAWVRFQHFINDMRTALGEDVGLRSIITVTWRTLWTQALAFQRMFEYTFLTKAIERILSLNVDASVVENFYVSDGSRQLTETPSGIPAKFPATTAQILPWQLQYDMERIASAKPAGAEAVIIYESPLHPTSAAHFDTNPTPHATQTRQAFNEACDALGLMCVTAPPSIDQKMFWSDASHPPRSVLGPHIRNLIAPYQSVCQP